MLGVLYKGVKKSSRPDRKNKYNKTEFLSCLASIDWMQEFSDLKFDPIRMTNTFHEKVKATLNSHAPLRKRKVRAEQSPWLNPGIKH